MKRIEIGDNVFVGEQIKIGNDLVIGHNNLILANIIDIGSNVSIGNNNRVLVGEKFSIDNTTFVGNDNLLEGKRIEIGANIWWGDENIIGHGGKWGVNSEFKLGSFSMVVGKCIMNVSDKITIGEQVGIGGEVNIWTHGSYLPILKGFPAQFGPVVIGDNVWLPARSIVLPNVTIGSNIVIAINSLVNKNIPNGCIAAGIPVKIIKENCYPKIDIKDKDDLIFNIIEDYKEISKYKNIDINISYIPDKCIILCNDKIFDLNSMKFQENLSVGEEDFRDYLRRRGIKFFGEKPFKSILPPAIRKLKSFYEKKN